MIEYGDVLEGILLLRLGLNLPGDPDGQTVTLWAGRLQCRGVTKAEFHACCARFIDGATRSTFFPRIGDIFEILSPVRAEVRANRPALAMPEAEHCTKEQAAQIKARLIAERPHLAKLFRSALHGEDLDREPDKRKRYEEVLAADAALQDRRKREIERIREARTC